MTDAVNRVPEEILKKCRDINDGRIWIGASSGTDIPPAVSFDAAIRFCWTEATRAQREKDVKMAREEARRGCEGCLALARKRAIRKVIHRETWGHVL